MLPRWLGWFNLWAQIIYLPGILIPYFKSGPLAWNGLLAFWYSGRGVHRVALPYYGDAVARDQRPGACGHP